MTNFTEKQRAYIEARANGITGRAAALAAGYSAAGADVTAAKLNRDPAIKSAIAKAKRAIAKGEDHDEEEVGGKKPKLKAKYESSLDLLRGVYNNPKMADSVRIDAAKSALPYEHPRIAEKGKKETAKERAKEIARGGDGKPTSKPKFATRQAPNLRVVK